MIEPFKSYFVKLERLSSTELDRSAEKLVVAESGNMAKLIAHIAEMSARKVALELGYKNLFDYCVQRLNLSEGAVPARDSRGERVASISPASHFVRWAVDGPWLKTESYQSHRRESPGRSRSRGQRRQVDFCQADFCPRMTRKETEEYLVALRPKPVFEPSIRKRPSRPELAAPPPQNEKLTPKAPEPSPEQTLPKSSRTILQPAKPDEFNFRFAADRDFQRDHRAVIVAIFA